MCILSQQICSCIGAKIDLYVLDLLLLDIHFVEGSETEDNITLAKASISRIVEEGLLAITTDEKGVTFIHDSVNEAAYFLLESEEQASYHVKLRQALHKHVCPTLRQKYLLTVATQLARGNELIIEEEDRIVTASIFLNAGEKSRSACAFSEAHFFFAKGKSLLRHADWARHYRLCCDIYMKDADTAAIIGDFRDMDECLAVLFKYCKGSLDDYLNASYIRVRYLATRDDPAAIDIGLEALKMAGENFPSRDKNHLVHIFIGLAKLRHFMKGKDASTLLEMPLITDKQTIAKLRLLRLLVNHSISANQKKVCFCCDDRL